MDTELSHATGATDKPPLDTTIGDDFDRTAALFPGREALVDVPTGRRWTYAELRAEVDALALALIEAGIARGDRVGIWAPNCAEWVMVQYATAKMGAVLVNINPAYRSHELAYALNQSGIRMLFAVASFKTTDYAAMVEEVAPGCPGLERAVYLGGEEWAALLHRGRLASPDRLAEAQRELSPDDPINIQYTSGTTGFPKGATLSHRNILNNGYFVGELLGYGEEDRICVPVPFYHCFGMVLGNLASTSHGACVVIPAPAFDPVATLTACVEERCTSLYGVPTMFIALLNVPDFASYDLSAMRTGVMAGSPCPVEVMKQVTKWAPEVAICYGMTETSPTSTQTTADDSLERRVSTVGRAHPHVEVKIIDPVTGETVPRGRSGELCTRGYSVMIGYWGEPEKTAEAVDTDGWMHTGDLGVMDEDGYLAITGRIKDLVIRGGENIYPREIEEFLYTHPDVLDAQVIGVPDEKYGEELMAWLRLREGAAPLDAAAVREFCSGKLAHFKIPRYVHCVDVFPMTVTGKIRKVEMRERALEIVGPPSSTGA
ncbi:fatty-acyl-CoA synthase [Streptomyces sp. yr375]|uniref:AMP-binding protein n=1 Tax=Streptomyces sp. yr375 TaxID=1761906 RepID=UPI0008CE0B72|nr:AMP-binding protein [Streptomyces sp. yr375]SES33239.1 fatty-acyl-CoA synthase [Streptomyces sp. yr375]